MLNSHTTQVKNISETRTVLFTVIASILEIKTFVSEPLMDCTVKQCIQHAYYSAVWSSIDYFHILSVLLPIFIIWVLEKPGHKKPSLPKRRVFINILNFSVVGPKSLAGFRENFSGLSGKRRGTKTKNECFEALRSYTK